MSISFNDFAIILSWPDATIRGDEQWMMFFKKIGIVKNLNFKVGHTGIIIIDHLSGKMRFYDFGRYVTPRGHGRARSEQSDPLLKIDFIAEIKNKKIHNIEDIVKYLEDIKPVMYGEGRLYFSIVDGINFHQAKEYGDQCVIQGTYPYGAIAKNNNNCSRFITRMLIKASEKYHFWHAINLPETIKSSPISNLVNSSTNRIIYSFSPEEGIQSFKMNRFQSLWFLLKQLRDNVFSQKAASLPNDQIIGAIKYNSKPINIPKSATYLGGVGDGAWYHIERLKNNQFTIQRFTSSGRLEYTVIGESLIPIPDNSDFKVTYDSNFLFTHISVDNRKIKIKHTKQILATDYIREEVYA